jgi:hypothetical protein
LERSFFGRDLGDGKDLVEAGVEEGDDGVKIVVGDTEMGGEVFGGEVRGTSLT